jgi:hypothetical protein
VAFGGSESTSETHEPDHDNDDRVGVAKIEVAATHFLQEKKHTNGHNNDGAAKATDGATLAVATNMIAHRCLTLEGAS